MANVLIIGSVWPEPNSSAAGTHMMQLIAALQTVDFKITFASSSQQSKRSVDLSELGINQVSIQLNHKSFNDFVSHYGPEIVIFDRFMTEEQFGWRVTEACPEALRILNTEDLHGLRHARELAVNDGKPFEKSYYFNDIFKREIASILRSDLSLIISEFEMEFLIQEFKLDEQLLHYFPFAFEPPSAALRKRLPSFSKRSHFTTIGNFLHPPNVDALAYLKKEIWPVIRKRLPDVEIHIYGAYMKDHMRRLHDENAGFLIKGFADDVNIIMQSAKVCLAPLRFGAGLKGKIITAMLNGTPCVTTSVGAEGICGDYESNGYVEDQPKEFVSRAISLYIDDQLWEKKHKNGFKILTDRFNKSYHEPRLIKRISETHLKLKQHRLNNFTGAMLQHQSLHSSKYLSKWIEEKNK